MSAGEIE
jgi:calmodulin